MGLGVLTLATLALLTPAVLVVVAMLEESKLLLVLGLLCFVMSPYLTGRWLSSRL